jgi:hypothetical protein
MKNATGKILTTLLIAGFAGAANAEIASRAYVDAKDTAAAGIVSAIDTRLEAAEGDIDGLDSRTTALETSASNLGANKADLAAAGLEGAIATVDGAGQYERSGFTMQTLATHVQDQVANAYAVKGTEGRVTALETTVGTYGDIVTHDAAEFATAGQGALAASAVQSVSAASGAAQGQIALTVDGTTTQVNVNGLGSAAYTASSAYDAAGSAAAVQATLKELATMDEADLGLGALAKAAPGTCGNASNKCLLTFDGTNFGWEVIARDALGE